MRRAVKLYYLDEVLEATGITRRTLRVYEEVGLVSSTVGEKNDRLYPEETVETVLRVQRIRRDLGVNLAGVHVILQMRDRIEQLQQDLDEVTRFVQQDLRHELEQFLRRQDKAVMPKPLSGLPRQRKEDED